MAFSAIEIGQPRAMAVAVADDTLSVDLSDGRTIAVPLDWYPRLAEGTASERANWRLIDRGSGIHWPDLDEDVSVSALLAGKPSAEAGPSLRRWLAARKG